MQSTIKKLFDLTGADISAEERRWHVTEEETRRALEALSKKHAAVQEAERVQLGDTAVCRTGDGETVLLYPGRDLPGAEEAEAASIGRTAEEVFHCRLGRMDVELRVEKILRLLPRPIDDALAALEGLPGVRTLEDFRSWHIREAGAKKRADAVKVIRRRLFQELLEKSEFALLEEEQDRWCREISKASFDVMLQMGQDPHIPEEGTELLTDEEALELLYREYLPMFREHVAYRYLSQQDGYECTQEEQRQEQERVRAERAAQGRSEDVGPAFAPFVLYEFGAYMDRGTDILTTAAEKYLEDR